FPSFTSTDGLGFSKVTEPGPLNWLQMMLAGAPWRARASGGCLPSSVTHNVNGNGSPDLTLNEAAKPRGGPVNAMPPDWNRITGGVLPTPASSKGSTIQSGSRCSGTVVVWPFAVMVQVRRFVPKSFGTATVNTPHCRRGRKCVGCP